MDKTKISAYLDDRDSETLAKLAAKHRVSKSQVVIMAIRALASGDNVEFTPSVTVTPNNGVTLEQVESAIKTAIAPLTGQLSEVMGEVETLKKPELAA